MVTNRFVRNKSFEVVSMMTRHGSSPQACFSDVMRQGMHNDTQAVSQ